MISPLETYRALKQAGATFQRNAIDPGKVDILLIEGTRLPDEVDAAMIVHAAIIGAIALMVDLREPRHWTRPVALAETRVVLDRIGNRLVELPEPMRTRVSHDLRPVVDSAMESIDRCFRRFSMSALRLTLLGVEAEVIDAIAAAERQAGN